MYFDNFVFQIDHQRAAMHLQRLQPNLAQASNGRFLPRKNQSSRTALSDEEKFAEKNSRPLQKGVDLSLLRRPQRGREEVRPVEDQPREVSDAEKDERSRPQEVGRVRRRRREQQGVTVHAGQWSDPHSESSRSFESFRKNSGR